MLKISESAYFYYKSDKYVGDKKYDKYLEKLIKTIHSNKHSQGHRKIAMVIRREYGYNVNNKTVLAYMKRLNIKVKLRKSNYSIPKDLKSSKYYANVINRDFKSSEKNRKWSIDITYVPYGTTRGYLFCIKDLFDKSIVANSFSLRMDAKFVVECLEGAFIGNNIKKNQLIVQADQGVHFSCIAYIALLEKYGVIGSHSRRGNCLDNAPIESFFSLFKKEALWISNPTNYEEVVSCIDDYMIYYNQHRYQVGLNEKTPHEIRFA
jgi:transposase InsO family protein